MQLKWYGTAALILKEDNISIAFDPFCGLQQHESLYSKNLSPDEQEFCKIKVAGKVVGKELPLPMPCKRYVCDAAAFLYQFD